MDHGKDVEERALSGRSAGRPGTAGKDPGRRELFGKPYEPELRMGGGIHSIPPHRFKAFRDGLSSRIRQRTDRITLLEEEIDLGTLQGTLKNLRSGRGKEGLGLDGSKPLKKLYAAAGPLTAMELEALCAPGGNNRTTATWQRRPSLQVPHILRKLRKGSDKMNLSHTLCGHSHINALARFLAVHPEIKTLELRNNGITDDGISMLSAALMASGGVTALDLSDNKLRWQGVQAIADMLTMKGTQLETLVLDGNRMEDRALEVLGQAMRENLVLRSLSIANCNISHLIANKMERVILNHGGLRELDLSWNKLGAVGARAVAKVLPESNLHVLNLSWTGLGDAGGVAVAAALKQNIALRDLVMSGNQLNTPFCEALVETLQANRSLRTLNLDDNPLGRGGTCALLKCYGRESKLTRLSIDRCTFLDDVVSFKDSRTFRVSNPAGRYRLDMEKPENQAILAALNDLYEGSKEVTMFKNVALDGADVPPGSILGDDMPKEGLVEFEFVSLQTPPGDSETMTDAEFDKSTLSIMQQEASDQWKLSLVTAITADNYFTSAQTAKIIPLFQWSQEKIAAASMLVGRIIDMEHLDLLFEKLNSPELNSLFNLLGLYKLFHPKLPTKAYALNLENHSEFIVAHRLLRAYKDEEARGFIPQDTDVQVPYAEDFKQTLTSWRNVEVDGAPVGVQSPADIRIERKGLLKLDYVSYLKLPAQPDMVTSTTFNFLVGCLQSEYLESPAVILQRMKMAAEKKKRVARYTPFSRVRKGSVVSRRLSIMAGAFDDNPTDEILVSDVEWAVNVIRAFAVDHWVSTRHVRQLCVLFGNDERSKCEVVVSLYSRISDAHKFGDLLRTFGDELQNLINHRLGYCNTVNWGGPSMHYKLKMFVPEDYVIALKLVKLAKMCKSQTFHNLRIDMKPINLPEDESMWAVLCGQAKDGATPQTTIELDYHMEDEQRTEAAVVMLQSSWKRYKERREFTLKKAAVKRLNTAVKVFLGNIKRKRSVVPPPDVAGSEEGGEDDEGEEGEEGEEDDEGSGDEVGVGEVGEGAEEEEEEGVAEQAV